MIAHQNHNRIELARLIKAGHVQLAGNKKLKIFGELNCASGKRMLKANRVFFFNENEARALGFRPCGHCMRAEFKEWLKSKHLH